MTYYGLSKFRRERKLRILSKICHPCYKFCNFLFIPDLNMDKVDWSGIQEYLIDMIHSRDIGQTIKENFNVTGLNLTQIENYYYGKQNTRNDTIFQLALDKANNFQDPECLGDENSRKILEKFLEFDARELFTRCYCHVNFGVDRSFLSAGNVTVLLVLVFLLLYIRSKYGYQK